MSQRTAEQLEAFSDHVAFMLRPTTGYRFIDQNDVEPWALLHRRVRNPNAISGGPVRRLPEWRHNWLKITLNAQGEVRREPFDEDPR